MLVFGLVLLVFVCFALLWCCVFCLLWLITVAVVVSVFWLVWWVYYAACCCFWLLTVMFDVCSGYCLLDALLHWLFWFVLIRSLLRLCCFIVGLCCSLDDFLFVFVVYGYGDYAVVCLVVVLSYALIVLCL